ncbi:MAG: polysaccharide pyruvyl transferase family protein [Fusicatenibacter sp.]|nr:polysaccharide pyruvyl transferase family protein [Lachnospiraceae bacterium]MDY2938246.1 polysaccharide pyruvyl transferase family protein [Fusicatenibacter sp.]
MGEIFLYNHGGSGNHGCEALIRTICMLLEDKPTLFSEAPDQDVQYDLQNIVQICPAIQSYSRVSPDFLKAYLQLKIQGNYFPMDILPYKQSLKMIKKGDVELSVGGDIYCYEDYPKFIKLHEVICNRGCKTVLIGCSLDEKLFEDPVFVEDMRRYDYISARESLTYRLLEKAGLDNIGYAPDTAFALPIEQLPLPEGFQEGNTIGLNVSPLVERKERRKGLVFFNYEMLIQWILENTDCSVALIPHVVWKDNDDRTILGKLYERFRETGRVAMIPDCNCMQLKGYISRCRMFVGARTHATIAAYSTCVPTLVLGYSIKSRGIATDLFGTEEHYVVPVEKLQEREDLTKAFSWMWRNEAVVRKRLETVMPEYVERTKDVRNKIAYFCDR